MNLSLQIAKRYLFGKKSTNAIQVITWISILGMSIGTSALIIILSVFNGFESLLSGLFNAYNPDIKIEAAVGQYLQADSSTIAKINDIKGVQAVSKTIETISLFEYRGAQEAGILKGVDDAFRKVTDIDSTLVRGKFLVEENGTSFSVLGSGMFAKLAVNPNDGITPITIYVPSSKKQGPLGKDFKTHLSYPKAVFSIASEEDSQNIITSLNAVQKLLEIGPEYCSAIEIKTSNQIDQKELREQLTEILGSNITIKDRYQQDEAFLKIMNIEKWISYLIACLTMIIIAFNLIGAIWMIVLDKKADIVTLRSLGMPDQSIQGIFLKLGFLIGLLGLVIGMIFSLSFYILQKKFHIIAVPDGFIMQGYPIELNPIDFLIVSVTVLCIALVAALLPSKRSVQVAKLMKSE